MRILIVSWPISLLRNHAAKSIILDLVDRTKFETHILTTKNSGLKLRDNIVKEEFFNKKEQVTSFQKFNLFLRLMKRNNIDIYNFFFQPTISSSLYSRFILKLKRKKVVQTIPNQFEDGANIKKLIFGDKIIVFSKTMYNQLRILYPNKVVHINPGIDCDKFTPKIKTDLKKRLNLEGMQIVLYAGGYRRERGLIYFLNTIKYVLDKNPGVRFIFACRIEIDEDRNVEMEVIEKAKKMQVYDSIVFLRTFTDMASLINICDLSVFPSIKPQNKMSIPLVLLESLAEEKPVLITDIQPFNELFEYGEVGMRLERGNTKSFSEAILSLLRDKERRRKMGKKGREVILKHFNIDETSKQFDNVYLMLKNDHLLPKVEISNSES